MHAAQHQGLLGVLLVPSPACLPAWGVVTPQPHAHTERLPAAGCVLQGNLTRLDVSGAGLTGTLPACLFQEDSSALVELYAAHNRLTGELPDSFSNSTKLQHLDLSHVSSAEAAGPVSWPVLWPSLCSVLCVLHSMQALESHLGPQVSQCCCDS